MGCNVTTRAFESQSALQMDKYRESEPNLQLLQPDGSKPPLLWVHGDKSDDYLPAYLGPNQPLAIFKHQGRRGEPIRHTRVETIAAHYLSQARAVQAAEPYFLGGYSFGGTVAFEMARQLEANGEKVALLFMVDSLCPGTDLKDPTPAEIASSKDPPAIVRLRKVFFGLKAYDTAKCIALGLKNRSRNRFSQVAKVFKGVLIRFYLVTGRPLPFRLRSQYILKIYFEAITRYVPKPHARRAIYIKSAGRPSYHAFRWNRLMAGGMDIYEIPDCNHMDIIKENYGGLWADKLRTSLMQSQEHTRAQLL
jgi:thioesterase domain-containing protein